MLKFRLVLLVAFCSVAIYGFTQISNSPKGIDVSRHNGTINWTKVATEPIEFVYIKTTEGATYVNPQFEKNIRGAIGLGYR